MAMRVGLIGGGNISETHARAAKAVVGVEVAAVFGANRQKVEHMAVEYGGTPYVDFEKFLEHRPMDFVAIGSPSGLHAEQGIAAARRGLHILTEKPLDISTRAADALIAAAAEAKVKLGVFFQDRFKADLIRVKQWMEEGVLGKPILADARVKWFRPPEYYGNSRWRGTLKLDGGGALINQAIHTVDLLLWYFGDVLSVQGQKKTALHRIEAEDTLVALLEFANGATGVFQAATSVYPGYPRRVELTGDEGTVIIEHDRLVAADLRKPAADAQGQGDDKNLSASSATVSDIRGHQSAMEDFVQAIEKNTVPRCSGIEGRRSLALVEAIYAACESGGRVELSKGH
ncbi:MAG TPA: Gfo/Idh/MocA family oxidoreductase [Candidatus Dormibacteraeota bacterium]|jgi:UDP-N-acetyl-2-amino-2-deoxyglucuronate dehydrogenase|nr:Gfo/Idh/MocA family oxidoreductase [Candidatus Dormibacteraeota bacterium]